MSIFRDDKGNVSSMRAVMLFTSLLFAAQWVIGLWREGTFTPSWELVSFVSAAVLGKSLQSFSERL